MKTKTSFILLFFFASRLAAQTSKIENETMADLMRSNGKIYVVVAVVVTILLGLILYLFRVEKKITSLEKEINKH